MGNQLRKYTKPIMNVERFTTDLNFADSSCDYYSQVNVPCIITGSHNIFYDACGDDNYKNMTTTEVTSTLYFKSAFDALSYLQGKTVSYSSSQDYGYFYELVAGEYLLWDNHAGLITPSVQSGINASA